MRILRSPEGCPWDHEQTLDTLRAFLLEETYEVLDAIDRKDYDALESEIGDLLLEAVFLAQVCAEEGRFTVADSLDVVVGKLIRRHPHIFPKTRGWRSGERGQNGIPQARRSTVRTASEVRKRWEQIKAQERATAGEPHDLLSGVPRTLPALMQAYTIGKRVATVGFDWSGAEDVMAKIEEEVAELRGALVDEGAHRAEEEMGDLLFVIANLARKLAIEPESALRRANEKFIQRFREVEARLQARGRSLHEATLEEMDAEWEAIKAAGH